MFDFAFSELAIIGVLALIIIGPKRLPVVARMAGKMLSQVNRYVSSVRREVEKEIELSEISELKKEFTEKTNSMTNEINKELSSVENSMQNQINQVTKVKKSIKKTSLKKSKVPVKKTKTIKSKIAQTK